MKMSKNYFPVSIDSPFLLFISFLFCSVKCLNNRPIVGIIAQETSSDNRLSKFGNSSITASYVKFLETGGARVVPIMIHKSQDYYEDLMRNINGVLFPGGGDLFSSDGYGHTAKIIFDIAVKMNDNGDFFPLWGTCLGFEALNYIAAHQKNWMIRCSAVDLPVSLNFVSNLNNSRMYKNVDPQLLHAMTYEKVTANYHHWCMTLQNYSLSGLDDYFKVLSTSQDKNNLTFISSVEAYDYPFYGIVFHPDIVLFEWEILKTQKNVPRTSNAIRVAQFFANFAVDEARKSSNKFPSKAAEDSALIYNYWPIYTGKLGVDSEQIYFFP